MAAELDAQDRALHVASTMSTHGLDRASFILIGEHRPTYGDHGCDCYLDKTGIVGYARKL